MKLELWATAAVANAGAAVWWARLQEGEFQMEQKVGKLLAEELAAKGLPPHFFEMGFRSVEEWKAHLRKKNQRRREAARILREFGSFREYWKAREEARALVEGLFDKRAPEKAAREELKQADLNQLFG